MEGRDISPFSATLGFPIASDEMVLAYRLLR